MSLTTKDALLERMVTATENLATNVPAKLNSAEMINSSGANYIKYESGIQICWGSQTVSNGVGTVTFPSDFKDTNYAVSITPKPAGQGSGTGRFASISGNSMSKSGFTGSVLGSDGALSATSFLWVAIGYWK